MVQTSSSPEPTAANDLDAVRLAAKTALYNYALCLPWATEPAFEGSRLALQELVREVIEEARSV